MISDKADTVGISIGARSTGVPSCSARVCPSIMYGSRVMDIRQLYLTRVDFPWACRCALGGVAGGGGRQGVIGLVKVES